MLRLRVLGGLKGAQMFMHADTHEICANTVRESALKAADSLILIYAFASSLFNYLFLVSSRLFVILILMYAFIELALHFDCQAGFDFDNVQRRELVNIYVV